MNTNHKAAFPVEAARLHTAFQWKLKEVLPGDPSSKLAVIGKRSLSSSPPSPPSRVLLQPPRKRPAPLLHLPSPIPPPGSHP
ncbi:Hypothetical predicted protein [Olea europaea subsp. europaea]|nr:Hypothetical predicted protein [Olea europaea subsp. europaea]